VPGTSIWKFLSVIVCTWAFFTAPASAQDTLSVSSKVVPIGTEYQNSIQLLNNRFRIDSDVSEVTIVFFREYGSAPIVLVRPDGSKLFLEGDAQDDSYTWFETDTYDMIALKNPTPGPWQAVGEVLPESRIMVIAGITLNAETIPERVYSGETLKQTAYLENAGQQIDMTQFRDVVALSIEFVSTNNPNYPNFGLGSRAVARFEDNGMGYDEKDGDGVFTGEFDLAITEGEWQPIFTVRTPLFSRQQINDKIVLLPNPIKVSHEIEFDADKDHLLTIDVDAEQVKLSSLLVEGSVRHPSGEIVKFSITELSDLAKKVEIINNNFGIYKINMKAFAQTLSGRDLVLTVPEYSFVTEPPPIVVEPVIEVEEPVEVFVPPEEESSPLLLVVLINLGLLIFGGLGLYLIVDKRNNPDNHLLKRISTKLKGIKFKKSKKVDEATKNSEV